MSIQLGPITLIPGVSAPIRLINVGAVQALKVSNGTPFDLTISGFGVQGVGTIPAGMEYMLYADVENTGVLNILPVNNTGVAGTGVANIDAYVAGETLPKGTWPQSIPVQIVQAKVSTVTVLINDGNAAGTQIVESTPSGDPGSAVSLLNTGVLVLGNATHHGSISSDNALFTTDGSGDLSCGTVSSRGNVTATGQIQANGAGTGLAVANNETVGGTLGVTGATTVGSLASSGHIDITTNNTTLRMKDAGGTLRDVLYVDASSATDLQAAALHGSINIKDQDGTTLVTVISTGITITPNLTESGTLTVTGASSLNGDATVPHVLNVTNDGVILKSNTHTIIDTTGGVDLILNSPSGTVRLRSSNVDKFTMDSSGNCTSNTLNLTGAGGLTVQKVAFVTGTLTRYTGFSGTGSGTFNTNQGATPSRLAFNPCTVSGSSQTIGGTEAQSSVVTTGAGLAWGGTAWSV